MDSLIKQLLDILSEEEKIYGALLELSENKKEALSGEDLGAINEIVKEEQALIATVQAREKARVKCTIAISQLSPVRNVSLGTISGLIPDNERGRYDRLCASLPQTLSSLHDQNEINRKLLETRLSYVHFVMDAMDPQSMTGTIYGAQGATEEPQIRSAKSNLYDQTV